MVDIQCLAAVLLCVRKRFNLAIRVVCVWFHSPLSLQILAPFVLLALLRSHSHKPCFWKFYLPFASQRNLSDFEIRLAKRRQHSCFRDVHRHVIPTSYKSDSSCHFVLKSSAVCDHIQFQQTKSLRRLMRATISSRDCQHDCERFHGLCCNFCAHCRPTCGTLCCWSSRIRLKTYCVP